MNINEKAFELGNRRSVIRELFEYGKKRKAEIGAENVFDFSLGNPSVKPPKIVNETLKELISTDNSVALHGYTSAQGDPNTRKAVADSLNLRTVNHVSAENVYMTCGAAASLTVTLKALMLKDEECIVLAPYFTEYKVFIENAGGKVIVSEPDYKDFSIDFNDLKSRFTPKTKAIIINSPNNPSGVVYSEETVKQLADLLTEKSREYGRPIYLISDEPYREIYYGTDKLPCVLNYYNNSVICYSYSKSLSLPGERIGYIALPDNMDDLSVVYRAVCGAGRSLGFVCAPSLFQKLVERCANLTVDINAYRENGELLYKSLLSYGYECVAPMGAFYLLVKTFSDDANVFCEKAKKLEILAVPCDDFGIKGYVRIAYCVDKRVIEKSLPAFKALAELYK